MPARRSLLGCWPYSSSIRRRKRSSYPTNSDTEDGHQVVDWLNTKSLESLKAVLHGFERFGGVPLPIRDLARDP